MQSSGRYGMNPSKLQNFPNGKIIESENELRTVLLSCSTAVDCGKTIFESLWRSGARSGQFSFFFVYDSEIEKNLVISR